MRREKVWDARTRLQTQTEAVSRWPPAAGDVLSHRALRPGSSAARQLDSKVNSHPTDNTLPANFALVRVMGVYSSLS